MDKKYPDYVYRAIRQRWSYDEFDDTPDAEIDALTPEEVLDEVATWEGLIHYGYTIRKWIQDIYGYDMGIES